LIDMNPTISYMILFIFVY